MGDRALRIHLAITGVWAALFIPSLLWWQRSLPVLVFYSVYANFVGHLSAYMAKRAERAGLTDDEMQEVLQAARRANAAAQTTYRMTLPPWDDVPK